MIAKNKKLLLAALEKNLGNVSLAVKAAGIARQTHYNYLRLYPEYKKQVEEIQSVALDFAEGCLFQQMKNGVPASTIFYLKTRGRSRGYIEKMPDGWTPAGSGGRGISPESIEQDAPEDSLDDIFKTLGQEHVKKEARKLLEAERKAEGEVGREGDL